MRSFLLAALASTMLVAGCVGGPDDLEAASTADPATPNAILTPEPFTWDGTYTPGLFVCPVVTCAGARVDATYVDLAPKGDITALALTLTWDAVSPTMTDLRFGITWDDDKIEYVEGPSPLVLEVDGLNVSKDDSPYLWTWPATPVPEGLATALTPQDFHAEGTITQLRAPDTDMAAAALPGSVITLDEQGSFGVGVVACVPVTCVGQTVVGGERLFPQDLQGAVDVSLVAEWEAASQATERMGLGVFACAKDCASDAEISDFEFVYGTSPLALDITGFDVPEGEILWVYMQQGGTSLPSLYALVNVPQDFALAGTIAIPAPPVDEAGGSASSVGP